jgi:hypothetical protein
VANVDAMVAVWDGGAADVGEQGLPGTVVWPLRASRT